MQGNGTSSNIHGKYWVGTEVYDQTWVMYTAEDNRIPKGSGKTNRQTDRICVTNVINARR